MIANLSLQLLGLQAIPRLSEKLNTKLTQFLTFSDLYGAPAEEFGKACNHCGQVLDGFLKEHSVSWWDIYLNSDIGMERTALAKNIGLQEDDTTLEIGCGRGYFTISAAKSCRKTIALDVMNGQGRHHWWKSFNETINAFGLKHRVSGLKADGRFVPLRDESIDKAVAVHSIRNFQDREAIRNAIREMNRVLSKDGELVVAENIRTARNRSQEAHLAMYECKCKYGQGDLFYFTQEELLQIFRESGLTATHVETVDYNLSASPPIFYLNTSTIKEGLIEEAQKEYREAVSMVKRYGETSPPTAIVRARKHPMH